MTTPSLKSLSLKVSMRAFRAGPAKVLRRAARTGQRVDLGEFVLVVRSRQAAPEPRLYGVMRATGKLTADPSDILSADDSWSSDE